MISSDCFDHRGKDMILCDCFDQKGKYMICYCFHLKGKDLQSLRHEQPFPQTFPGWVGGCEVAGSIVIIRLISVELNLNCQIEMSLAKYL